MFDLGNQSNLGIDFKRIKAHFTAFIYSFFEKNSQIGKIKKQSKHAIFNDYQDSSLKDFFGLILAHRARLLIII